MTASAQQLEGSIVRLGPLGPEHAEGLWEASRDEHGFEALGCRRVEFKTDEGVHRNHMLVRSGENRDSAWYSVIEEEWPAVREALRARLLR